MKTFNQSVVTLALLVFAAPVFAAEQEGVQSRVLQRTLDAMRKPAAVVPAVQPVHVAPVVIPVQPVIEQVSRNPEGVVARTLGAIRNEAPVAQCKSICCYQPEDEIVASIFKKLNQIDHERISQPVIVADSNVYHFVDTSAQQVVQEASKETVKEVTQEAAQKVNTLWSKAAACGEYLKDRASSYTISLNKLSWSKTKDTLDVYKYHILAGVAAAAICYKGFKMYQAYQAKKVEQKK